MSFTVKKPPPIIFTDPPAEDAFPKKQPKHPSAEVNNFQESEYNSRSQ